MLHTSILLMRVWDQVVLRLVMHIEFFLIRMMLVGTKQSKELRIELLIKQNRIEFEDSVKIILGSLFGLSNEHDVDTRKLHRQLDKWKHQYARAVNQIRASLDTSWRRLKLSLTIGTHTRWRRAARNSFMLHIVVSRYVARYIYLNGGLIYNV